MEYLYINKREMNLIRLNQIIELIINNEYE